MRIEDVFAVALMGAIAVSYPMYFIMKGLYKWKIKVLEDKLNGSEFKELSLKKTNEIQQMLNNAEQKANKIIQDGQQYITNLKGIANREIQNKRNSLQNDINHFLYQKSQFEKSYIDGRKWLIGCLLEIQNNKDELDTYLLINKKNPAIKAAEKLAEIQKERRELLYKYKHLEYQLKTYEEYFPFLVDYQNEILNDEIRSEDNTIESTSDPVNKFLSSDEYVNLSTTEKNQLALDRYIHSHLSKSGIGKMYERYLGYQYEKLGYAIEYTGIENGLEDLGRDLICTKEDRVIIIQAKCWSSKSLIREKHIFQLFSTALLHQMDNPDKNLKYTSILYTTATLSDVAREVADRLDVGYEENFKLDKEYPMIKCNIGKQGEKIYHLPFDQMYDKVKIKNKGEFYALTVAEAEKKGFRRAFRFRGIVS